MGRKLFFMAGSYGVGKTTICNQLTETLGIPSYSASTLISNKNNELYGQNKYVKDSDNNQKILINEVKKIKDNIFILNGYFCLNTKEEEVVLLEERVFEQLDISTIVLISADSRIIKNNLFKRDNRNYTSNFIDKLVEKEKIQAQTISKKYNIPLIEYKMKFDENDINDIINIFKNAVNIGKS